MDNVWAYGCEVYEWVYMNSMSSMYIAHTYECVFMYALKVYVECWYTCVTSNMRVHMNVQEYV